MANIQNVVKLKTYILYTLLNSRSNVTQGKYEVVYVNSIKFKLKVFIYDYGVEYKF